MSAILSFLGGSAFRMIWGEISAYLNKKQDHQQEYELLKLQGELDAVRHERNMEALRTQSELGIKEVQVKGEIELDKIDGMAFWEAQKTLNRPTGIKLIDAWNGCIRPSAATVALLIWVMSIGAAAYYADDLVIAVASEVDGVKHVVYQLSFISDWDRSLMGMVFGFFFADRSLSKRGK